MDFSHKIEFNKELPGTTAVFQPEDLDDYRKDAWDIRISIGDAPLEEAYYFTVDDPGAVGSTIGDLLDSYALNPAMKSQLNVDEDPDLPFLQDELIQYQANERAGLLELEYYVNHNPESCPVDLNERAERFLSVCTSDDGSLDYRVLDLVILPSVTEPSESEIEEKQKTYGRIYLLLLLDYFSQQGNKAFRKFLQQPPMASFLGPWTGASYRAFANGMRHLELDRLIKTSPIDDESLRSKKELPLEITETGRQEIERLKRDSHEIQEIYDKYDSVSVAPPALGVPDGFDVRVQMIEFDGLDCERSVLLRVLDESKEEYFGGDDWGETYEEFSFFKVVKMALAFKTNFSAEILEELKELWGTLP